MPASPPTVSREFRRDRSLRRIPGLPFRLVGRAQTMSKLFPLRSCSTLCLGTASGLLRRPATAKPLLCLRPRPGSGSPGSGPPRKAASGLGSRAHSIPGARDRRAETEKRMYLNRITLIGFLGGDAEKKVSNATNIAVFSLATKTSWKNDAGTWETRTEWHRCVAFGRLAEFVATLSKGAHVAVEGELRSHNGTESAGAKPTELPPADHPAMALFSTGAAAAPASFLVFLKIGLVF